jgi:hypothetical protein
MDVEPAKTAAQIAAGASSWFGTICYASFAAFAGGLGYVLRSMEANQPVSLTRIVVEALAAGLVGLLAMWICQAVHLSMQWTAVTVGVCGWLGANASIQVLQRIVWKKLGLSPQGARNDRPSS